jgi:GT2 family glycosyltransferase
MPLTDSTPLSALQASAADHARPGAEEEPDTSRVTVVIPTYNRRENLRRCLSALLACDLEGVTVELRVVDDGSRDGTATVVEELKASAPAGFRIHYHRQENAGQSAARNLGIAAADTDLILFLDDDCVPERGWVLALADAGWDRETAAVGGRIISPDRGNWVARYCRYIRFNEYPPEDGVIRYVNTANCAYQRRVLREVGGFELLVSGGGEDHELVWRVERQGYRVRHQPEAVVRHYHRESVTILARTLWLREYRITLRDVLWKRRPAPTWASLWTEGFRLLKTTAHLLLLPLDAARRTRRGAGTDAWGFAFLGWLQRVVYRVARVRMMFEILTGRQGLERSSPLPAGAETPLVTARDTGE